MMERPQLGTCLYMISYVSDRDPGLGHSIVRPVILCACYEGPPAEIFLKRTDGTTVWVRQDKLGSQVFTSAGEAAEAAAAWTEKLRESWRRL